MHGSGTLTSLKVVTSGARSVSTKIPIMLVNSGANDDVDTHRYQIIRYGKGLGVLFAQINLKNIFLSAKV